MYPLTPLIMNLIRLHLRPVPLLHLCVMITPPLELSTSYHLISHYQLLSPREHPPHKTRSIALLKPSPLPPHNLCIHLSQVIKIQVTTCVRPHPASCHHQRLYSQRRRRSLTTPSWSESHVRITHSRLSRFRNSPSTTIHSQTIHSRDILHLSRKHSCSIHSRISRLPLPPPPTPPRVTRKTMKKCGHLIQSRT